MIKLEGLLRSLQQKLLLSGQQFLGERDWPLLFLCGRWMATTQEPLLQGLHFSPSASPVATCSANTQLPSDTQCPIPFIARNPPRNACSQGTSLLFVHLRCLLPPFLPGCQLGYGAGSWKGQEPHGREDGRVGGCPLDKEGSLGKEERCRWKRSQLLSLLSWDWLDECFNMRKICIRRKERKTILILSYVQYKIKQIHSCYKTYRRLCSKLLVHTYKCGDALKKITTSQCT